MIYTTTIDSPLGKITIADQDGFLIGLWFEQQQFDQKLIEKKKVQIKTTSLHLQVEQWLKAYFAKEKPDIRLIPIKLIGTSFQKEVWEILLAIPYGQTTSYGLIAKTIAQNRGKAKMSGQAVGQAVGHNPIGIIVPCHRVIGTNGKLTGYAGGLDKKNYLLQLEKE